MASIKLTQLAKKVNTNSNIFTYVDLHLDLVQTVIANSNTNAIRGFKRKDLEVDNDEAAIRNSIFNILSTRPGQRFLIPTFGCNLLGYVGQPVTTQTGQQIGNTIYNAIRIWEPRVTLDEVLVIAKPSDNEYDIQISITIPALKKTGINLISTLTNSGILESRLN